MQIQLYCPACSTKLVAPPDAPAVTVLDEMFEHGPCFALGDGATFEDMIFHALTAEGKIICPECDEPVAVSEQTIGELAQEMIYQM